MDPITLVVAAISLVASTPWLQTASRSVTGAYARLRIELNRRGVAVPQDRAATRSELDALSDALHGLQRTDRAVDVELLRAATDVADALAETGMLREWDAAKLGRLRYELHAVVDVGDEDWPDEGTRGGADHSRSLPEGWSSPLPPTSDDDWDEEWLGGNFGPPMPGTLGGGTPPVPHPTGATDTEPAVVEEPRWINAEVEDVAPTDVLRLGQTVTLAFDVDVRARRSALGASRLPDVPLFKPGVDEVALTIQLDSDDFDIGDHSRPLRLPRTGPSRGKARFDITPRLEGRCFLTAIVHRDGNFVQKLDLALSVGTPEMDALVTGSGRPLAVESLLARDLTLVIEPAPGIGYTCTVLKAAGFSKVTMPITDDALADAVDTARDGLMAVVNSMNDAGELVFQTAVDIPDAQRDAALQTLARSGARLFTKVFSPPNGGADLAELGEYLRTMALGPDRLTLQIVAKDFAVPWGLMYLGDAFRSATLDWDNFLGLRSVVELLPLQTSLAEPSPVIASDQPTLAVGTVMNSGIDTTMRIDAVARQETFWNGFSSLLSRTSLDRRDDVLDALSSNERVDVLYFYCHATAPALRRPGGLDAAALTLVDASLTLGELGLDAPPSAKFAGSPLVFINACESAEMSPLFYDGFVPYFLGKGARGVVGTECKTPALLAAAWAQRFFERFLAGEALGDAVLGLRRELLQERGNPLGLVYCVHCDSDVHVRPALARPVAPTRP